MLRPRRTHKKSKNECFECKRRRLKCDERNPICSGCIKHETTCEYPNREPLLPTSPRPASRLTDHSGVSCRSGSAPSSTEGRSVGSLAGNDPPVVSPSISSVSVPALSTVKKLGEFDTQDLVLWHQFIVSTSGTMSTPWKRDLPSMALSCEYLMHGMISTAALHFAHLYPDQRSKYELLSTHHQNVALPSFQADVSNSSAKNCSQVFAFSILLIVSHFASSYTTDASHMYPRDTLYEGLAGWVTWHRGCCAIVAQAKKYIEAGPLGPLIDEENLAQYQYDMVAELPKDENYQSLERLLNHIQSSQWLRATATGDEIDAYVIALTELRRLLASSSRSPECLTRRKFASLWPAILPETFIRVLHELQPPALAIMAHFCLLLKTCDTCWYTASRSGELLDAVQQSLSAEWIPYIQWPLQVFGKESSAADTADVYYGL